MSTAAPPSDAAERQERYPNAAETLELFRRYSSSRDPQLRDRLVAMHDRMVRYLASRYAPSGGAAMEDLVQVGYIGLLAAIERFDPEKGVSFVTFAVPTITGEIKRFFRDHTWALKAPRRLRELGLTLRRHREELEQRLGRSPTIAEMAEAANVSEERLLAAMELNRVYQPASLDHHLMDANQEEGSSGWEALGKDDPSLQAAETRVMLFRAMRFLDDRQREIIRLRFFEDASQAEVARRLGISQMHVSRLERQILQRLRSLMS